MPGGTSLCSHTSIRPPSTEAAPSRLGDGFVGALLDFGNLQKGLLLVIENELLIIASLQPNRLGRFIADHIGAPGTYQVTEKSVPAPYYLPDKDKDRVKSVMDAANFKIGVGDRISGFSVPFENGQVRKLLIGRRNGNRSATVDRRLTARVVILPMCPGIRCPLEATLPKK